MTQRGHQGSRQGTMAPGGLCWSRPSAATPSPLWALGLGMGGHHDSHLRDIMSQVPGAPGKARTHPRMTKQKRPLPTDNKYPRIHTYLGIIKQSPEKQRAAEWERLNPSLETAPPRDLRQSKAQGSWPALVGFP